MTPHKYVTGLEKGNGLEFGHVAPVLLNRLQNGMASSSAEALEVGRHT